MYPYVNVHFYAQIVDFTFFYTCQLSRCCPLCAVLFIKLNAIGQKKTHKSIQFINYHAIIKSAWENERDLCGSIKLISVVFGVLIYVQFMHVIYSDNGKNTFTHVKSLSRQR